MKIWMIAVMWYILGTALMYIMGYAGDYSWKHYYYIWDKTAQFLFVFAIWQLIHGYNRHWLLPMLFFSLIRVIWAIIVYLTGHTANDPKIVTILFCCLCVASLICLTLGLLRWRRRNL